MLKVVGASWQKTRIGTYILIGAGLLVIGAFFIAAMERPHYDGTYCATALWSEKIGFQIRPWKQQNDLVNIPKGAARVCYKDSIYENGWAQLEIETQRAYPDWVQAYAAGMLEGQLTWSNIYNQWSNTISSSCDRDENSQKFCEWLRSLLSRNYFALKLKALERGKHDHYWHQISLYFSQLEGLETGYTRGATRARSDLEEDIPFTDFLLMNAAADIQDLKIYFENFVLNATENSGATAEEGGANDGDSPRNFLLPSATMLTKIYQTEANPNVWQLLFGHSSAGSYSSMLRIQKRYKFRYHFTPNQRTNTVPGMDITFTGYPGILGSTDDFYIIKGRQVQSIVAGVPLMNGNLKLWNRISLRDMIPLTARVMAANRMSQNRRSWAKAMAHHPVTGGKQWITIDLNKLNCSIENGNKHSDNLNDTETTHIVGQRQSETLEQCRKSLVWIVEQLPGKMRIDDVTSNFLLPGNSTWIANGIPYFDDILELSAIAKDNFSVELDDEKAITSLRDVDTYLRTHGFRGDLLGEQSVAYGNIDIKLFSHNQPIGVSDYHAFAGPIYMRLDQYLPKPAALESINSTNAAATTSADSVQNDDARQRMIIDGNNFAEIEMITERRPVRHDIRAIAMRRRANGNPFKWSKADVLGVQHVGHPDEWNFDQIKPKWAW